MSFRSEHRRDDNVLRNAVREVLSALAPNTGKDIVLIVIELVVFRGLSGVLRKSLTVFNLKDLESGC